MLLKGTFLPEDREAGTKKLHHTRTLGSNHFTTNPSLEGEGQQKKINYTKLIGRLCLKPQF